MSALSIRVAERFRGPPESGNGGYASGLIAGALTDRHFSLPNQIAAEVTLRAPVPLDTTLRVRPDDDALRVLDGERLIAESVLTILSLDIPEPASWDEALAARPSSPALQRGFHPWLGEERLGFHPVCFCCGAELAPDEGLHVYAAPIAGRAQVAAAWTPHARFANDDGVLPPEIVSAALDCPGQYAWLAEGTRTGMLGRLSVRIEVPVRAEQPYVVIGWTLGREGRKFHAGTALFDQNKQLCAYAKAVWIGPKDGD